jgi:hypothetical protein
MAAGRKCSDETRISRAVAGTVDDVTTLDVFNAATVGGARALLRDSHRTGSDRDAAERASAD